MILQVVVFIGAALVLFGLRSNDLTAGSVGAGARAERRSAAGGPLLGAEQDAAAREPPDGLHLDRRPAAPFRSSRWPILYFPSRSPLMARFPALHIVPVIVAAPMIAGGLATSLYLVGVDAARDAALWDAAHPGVFYASFAAASASTFSSSSRASIATGSITTRNERRRIRMAVYTGAPGVWPMR